MFLFANLLLLALFAAAACDLWLGVRRAAAGPGRLGRALQNLWRQEHLLFGGWGGGWRTRAGAVLFCVGLGAYELSVAFCNSMARDAWPWVQGVLSPLLDGVAFGCFGLKILLGTRYNWRQLGLAGALYFIARWVHFNAHNIWWIGLVVAVLAAKDLPLKKPLTVFVAVGAAAMLLVAGLNAAGALPPPPDLATERNVYESRSTYGYGHPNTFGGLLFGLLLAWTMLRSRRPRWVDAGLVAALSVFLLMGPASRSAGLAGLALAAGLALCRLWGRRPLPRPLPWLGAAVVPAMAAVSYLLPLLFVKVGPWWSDLSPAWLSRLDSMLNGRLSMIWCAYRLFPIKIAGQPLQDWPALDNSFLFTFYQFGPVVALLLAVGLMIALWGYARRGEPVLLVCLVVMLIYAFMECQSFHLTTNPAALLLAGVVFALPLRRWGAADCSPQDS